MNPTEYGKQVLVTESKDMDPIKGRIDTKMIRLLHAGLGMSSELSELTEAHVSPKNESVDWVNIMEEVADVLWYTAVAVSALEFDHEEISSFESLAINNDSLTQYSETSLQETINTVTWAVGNYNDLLKKHMFYGRELDMEKMKRTLQQICTASAGVSYVSGHTMEQCRERNIAKLRARYGDKFSEYDALNRDLETERKILEGETA
jgi:NTP pyrophosphatase (non-canonical NTP hydrolase)